MNPVELQLRQQTQEMDFSVIVVSMGSKEPLNRFKVTRHLLDELFKKYEGLIVGSPGKSVQNLAPIPLEGGTEETLKR